MNELSTAILNSSDRVTAFPSRLAPRGSVLLVIAAVMFAGVSPARAVTPESPEVKELIAQGLKFLETKTSDKLGGKCLIGLCFLKTGKKDHPRVAEALYACQQATTSGGGPTAYIQTQEDHVYSNGIAIIFLCELDHRRHADLIRFFLDAMKQRQKPDGSWGYNGWESGDTSQTQYGALAYWEAHRRGFSIEPESVEKLANWLRNVQDPSGGWGYVGTQGESGRRVPQVAAEITCSRVSASIGSALICADLFGLLRGGVSEAQDVSIPTALREANEDQEIKIPPLKSATLDSKGLFETIQLGDQWMDKNYQVSIDQYTSYYMYALERYKSFQELQTGIAPDEPDWYNKGYEYLKESQQKPGVWETGCLEENDTAFSILFLLRSTQKSIRQSLGEGTLFVGRGIPANLSRAKLKDGQLVVEQTQTQVSELLNLLDEDQQESLDALIGDPTALVVTDVDENSGRRLQQLVRSGTPAARIVATRGLGRTGNLDYVPSLIYALTDPDHRVVHEADAGLRFISRKFSGVGLAEGFTDRQRYDAIDRWKTWYRGLRPDAQFLTE